MRLMMLAALAAGTAIATAAPAEARQGCGPGHHRGYHGRCMANHGRRGPVVIGRYYHGRGYWDGHRYFHHRYRFHGGWRYR